MGSFSDYFTGNIDLDQCIVHVDEDELYLTFDDSAGTGLKAEFFFNPYTDESSYPAYKFQSTNIYKDNELVTEPIEEQAGTMTYNLYSDISRFNGILQQCETSIQIVTANQTLFCHIILKNPENNKLLMMGQLYGYLL